MLPSRFDTMNYVRVIFTFHSDTASEREGVYFDYIEFNNGSTFNITPIRGGFDGCCSDGDCDDGDDCTTDSCTEGSCSAAPP